jgi:hypothetical protein
MQIILLHRLSLFNYYTSRSTACLLAEKEERSKGGVTTMANGTIDTQPQSVALAGAEYRKQTTLALNPELQQPLLPVPGIASWTNSGTNATRPRFGDTADLQNVDLVAQLK